MWTTIKRVPLGWQADMCSRVLLTGGAAALPNLPTRVARELAALAPSHVDPSLSIQCNRKTCGTDAWIGGAMFSTLSTFEDLWITKAQFEEHGAGIVHRKCL